MDDPFFSEITAYCGSSSSQEELLKNSKFAREDSFPEPIPSPPSPTSPNFDENHIPISSVPDTPPSETAVSLTADEFKTPPEESLPSSSQEPPPIKSDGPGIETIVAETERDRVGEKRDLSIEESTLSQEIRVSRLAEQLDKMECKKKSSDAEEPESGCNVDVVMEVLKWLADEQRQKKKKKTDDHDNDEPVDFLATLRRRGVVFPEPKWWNKKQSP